MIEELEELSVYDDMIEEHFKKKRKSYLDFIQQDTLYDVIADWWDEIFINGNPSGQNIESLIDKINEWLPDEQNHDGSQRIETVCAVDGYNECLLHIKSKLIKR